MSLPRHYGATSALVTLLLTAPHVANGIPSDLYAQVPEPRRQLASDRRKLRKKRRIASKAAKRARRRKGQRP